MRESCETNSTTMSALDSLVAAAEVAEYKAQPISKHNTYLANGQINLVEDDMNCSAKRLSSAQLDIEKLSTSQRSISSGNIPAHPTLVGCLSDGAITAKSTKQITKNGDKEGQNGRANFSFTKAKSNGNSPTTARIESLPDQVHHNPFAGLESFCNRFTNGANNSSLSNSSGNGIANRNSKAEGNGNGQIVEKSSNHRITHYLLICSDLETKRDR